MSQLVSVIIPSFNHAKYIDQAVESVLTQTYDRWELIIIDDGSIDGTERVLDKYVGDPRIRIILNKENRGQGFVLNQAMALAAGEFLCFLPSDDWFVSTKLERQMEKFKYCDHSTGVVYGRGARFFEDRQETIEVKLPMFKGRVLRELIVHGNFVYPITPMFRKSCFSEIRFDESYSAEGEAIYLKIAKVYEFDYVEDVVGVMRDHSYNTGKRIKLMYKDNYRYWTDFFLQDDLPSEVKGLKNFCIARLQRMTGLELISICSEFSEGRNLLLSAIYLYPKFILDYKCIGAYFLTLLPEKWIHRIINWRKKT